MRESKTASSAQTVELPRHLLAVAASLAAAIALVACGEIAIGARSEKVVPEYSPPAAINQERAAKSVVVAPVTGALRSTLMDWGFSETFPMAPEDFQSAVAATVRRSGLFAAVATQGSADYLLDVNVLKGSARPEAIFATEKSSLFVAYKLIDTASGNVIWQDDYYSESVAPFTGEGPAVGKEDTIRKNLEQLVRGLSAADLPVGPHSAAVVPGQNLVPATESGKPARHRLEAKAA